jgi:hypothetical protein
LAPQRPHGTITCRAKHRTRHIEVAADSVEDGNRGQNNMQARALRPAMDLLPIDEHHIYDI